MALPTTVTIADAGAVNRNFVLQDVTPQGGGKQRINDATTIQTPQLLIVRHQPTGASDSAPVNPGGQDRHNLLWSTDIRTATTLERASLSVVLTVSRNTAVTRTHVNDLIAYMRNFFNVTGNVDAILRNES